jgi:hypothetical protein
MITLKPTTALIVAFVMGVLSPAAVFAGERGEGRCFGGQPLKN